MEGNAEIRNAQKKKKKKEGRDIADQVFFVGLKCICKHLHIRGWVHLVNSVALQLWRGMGEWMVGPSCMLYVGGFASGENVTS